MASSCETVLWRGALVCKHSVHKLEAAARLTGANFLLRIIQGSYSTRIKESVGTHAAGGVTDEELDGHSWSTAVMVDRVFRSVLLLHWIRWWLNNHHGHAIDPECPNLAPAAVAQCIEFGKGGDGLVGDNPDPGDRTYAKQIYALFLQRRSVPARVRLIQRGLGLTPVDGVWGPQTDAAISKVRATKTTGVRAVQTGLLTLADGKWGPATDAAYLSLRAAAFNKPTTTTTAPVAPKPPAPTIDKTLPYGPFPYPNGRGSVYGPSTAGKNWWSGKVGSRTVSVTAIRANIKRIQKACRITQDGIYGPVTARAVAAWQKSHKLYVDGLVGPQTWNSM
jgi:peptidoglycan hydrolase-like protein with peptidoglycan-binding domain